MARRSRPFVVPAVLERTASKTLARVWSLSAFSPRVHLDLMDGRFVRARSPGPSLLRRLPRGVRYQAHLMVRDPLHWVLAAGGSRVRRVIVHVESNRVLEAVRRGRVLGLRVWVAISPRTPLRRLQAFLPLVDGVLLMSVVPGAQSRPFERGVYTRLRALRRRRLPLSVDGGVSVDRAARLARAGVHELVVGSRITLADNPRAAYRSFARALRGV